MQELKAVKNLEAILRANDLAMLQIYFETDSRGVTSLRVNLVEFDADGDSHVDEELSVEADQDEETIEDLLAILETQAEITLRENAAEVFWKAKET